jgi:exonuclease SbcC
MEVERWRWAEIEQAKIEDALKQKQELDQKIPPLKAVLAEIVGQLASLQSDYQQQSDRLHQAIRDLNYHPESHSQLLHDLREAQPGANDYQRLQTAITQLPQQIQRLAVLDAQISQREAEKAKLELEIATLSQQIADHCDPTAAIATLEQSLRQQRQDLDHLLGEQGRIDQILQHLEDLALHRVHITQQIQTARHQHRVHQELTLAFGKTGFRH